MAAAELNQKENRPWAAHSMCKETRRKRILTPEWSRFLEKIRSTAILQINRSERKRCQTTVSFKIHCNLVSTLLLMNTTIALSTINIIHSSKQWNHQGKWSLRSFMFPKSPAPGKGKPLISPSFLGFVKQDQSDVSFSCLFSYPTQQSSLSSHLIEYDRSMP